jgi:hypothetical protein
MVSLRQHELGSKSQPGITSSAPLATAGKLSLTSRHDGLSESLDVGITQIQLEQVGISRITQLAQADTCYRPGYCEIDARYIQRSDAFGSQ